MLRAALLVMLVARLDAVSPVAGPQYASVRRGFEDYAYCPAGWCLRELSESFIGLGPQSLECFDEEQNKRTDEEWMGSLTTAKLPPNGWTQVESVYDNDKRVCGSHDL